MKNYLNKLISRHRELNRQIDNRKAAGWQKEVKRLKQLRLQIKDQIHALRRQRQASAS